MRWPMSSKRSTTSDGPCRRQAARLRRWWQRSEKYARSARRRACRHLPGARRQYRPIMRAMMTPDTGCCGGISDADERRLEYAIAASRAGVDIPVDAQRSGIASPTLETMRARTRPELTAELAMPTAPFNVSGNPAICLPRNDGARAPPLGVSSSAVNSTSTCSSERPAHFSKCRVSSPTPAGVKNPRPQRLAMSPKGRSDRLTGMFTNTISVSKREDALSISAIVFDRDGVLTS